MPTYKRRLTVEDAYYFKTLTDSGLTYTESARIIKEKLGLSHTVNTLKRTLPEMLKLDALLPEIENALPPELIANYQDCYIMGDAHMPYINHQAMIEMLTQAKQEGIKTLVLNGDALDFDWASHFMAHSAPASMKDVEYHRRAIYDIMYALAGVFSKIYITRGNHDERLLKKADLKMSLQSAWHMFACPDSEWVDREGKPLPNLLNICEITERFYMKMNRSPTGDWLFCHQKNYSVIPGRVAGRLASKEQCNVVTAHEHHLAIVTDGTVAQNYAVNGGCMLDPKKIEYKNMRHTLHPYSAVGWVVLRGGVPCVYHWEKLKGRR